MGIRNREGALWMATGIDNSGMRRDAKEAEQIIDGIGDYAKKTGMLLGGMFALQRMVLHVIWRRRLNIAPRCPKLRRWC